MMMYAPFLLLVLVWHTTSGPLCLLSADDAVYISTSSFQISLGDCLYCFYLCALVLLSTVIPLFEGLLPNEDKEAKRYGAMQMKQKEDIRKMTQLLSFVYFCSYHYYSRIFLHPWLSLTATNTLAKVCIMMLKCWYICAQRHVTDMN